MKILVTGSAGFIGFHLARRFLQQGHSVAGVDALVPYYDVRLKQRRHAILAESGAFRPHILNLAELPKLAAVMREEQPDIILHLAAQAGVRYALEHPESYVESNILGSFNLLELCRQRPVRHLLIASTSSAYGANAKMPFEEQDATATPLNIYAASKLSMEAMAHSHAHLWRQPITAFRFFTVYGPWGRPDMALFKFTDAILRGRPIDLYNHGRMRRDFTYIDDLVEAVARLVETVPEPGRPVAPFDSLSPVAPYRLVNIGNSAPCEVLDLVAEIERCTGRKAQRNLMAMQPGEVPATWASTRLLEALTGFRAQTPLAEGVARFVAWFRDHYGV